MRSWREPGLPSAPAVCRRALTLLEVLISIALIMTLLGAMFAFSWDMLGARGHIVEATAQRRAATILIERLERDLATCIVGDDAMGAGVSGDATTIRILTRSVPVRLAGEAATTTHAFRDLELAEYRFDEPGRVIQARRAIAGTNGGEQRHTFHELGGPVSRVRFRFHDGAAWRDSFDSLRANRLPAAVEVALWFNPWPGEMLEADEAAAEFAEETFAPAERMTFDEAAGFDEHAFAESSDLEVYDEPRPDRLRVIVVPDAAGDDASGVEFDPAMTDEEGSS